MELKRNLVITGIQGNKEYAIPVPSTLSEDVIIGFTEMINHAPTKVSEVVCIKLVRELLHCSLSDAVAFVRDLRWNTSTFDE
jgi:hypothetical protein